MEKCVKKSKTVITYVYRRIQTQLMKREECLYLQIQEGSWQWSGYHQGIRAVWYLSKEQWRNSEKVGNLPLTEREGDGKDYFRGF